MYYEELIKFMTPFFDEQGLTADENGIYTGKGKKVKINYSESKKVYELLVADEESDEYKTASAYLFDETQNKNDIEAVAIDFIDTLHKQLGVKKVASRTGIELPSDLGGDRVGLGGLTQKLLAIFPQYKETYKQHVADYGKFLAVNFFHENFIPSVKQLLESGNKKQIKKFYDAMCDIYIDADADTVPFVVGVVAAAVYDNTALLETVKDYTEECPTYAVAVRNFAENMKHNKKLKNCF